MNQKGKREKYSIMNNIKKNFAYQERQNKRKNWNKLKKKKAIIKENTYEITQKGDPYFWEGTVTNSDPELMSCLVTWPNKKHWNGCAELVSPSL